MIRAIKIGMVLSMMAVVVGCNYRSNVMMKTKKDYQFDPPPQEREAEYVVSPSDILEFQLYTNDGSVLVDLTAIKEEKSSIGSPINPQYLVEFNGNVRLPLIGNLDVKGKTIRELETLLEETYSKYYIKPFVKLKVANKRVTVFPGGSGQAKVVPLLNNNMRIIEALGAVGGLTPLAKAKRVKLIRGNLSNPQVFLFDFSTLEGLQESDFVLQANDIIYVEPRSDYFQQLIRDVAPVVGLLTSTITLIVVIQNTTKN
ncbi:MAG: polysaccharide biosynthesis/export family protein [Flavobacteriales bacterium]|nr:polysaccharide biosynthesis/export family protein [Flavobacteriales bacterium]